MSKTAWIGLVTGAACAAFAAGVAIGGAKKTEVAPRPWAAKGEARTRKSDGDGLLARLEELRKSIAEEDKRIANLKDDLEKARAKLPVALTPEEEKEKREREEQRKRNERRRALYEQTKDLRTRILQRKDKALRAEALEELSALIRSSDTEELLFGLVTLNGLRGFDPLNREQFKPDILAALEHENPEVRRQALTCMYSVCSNEEQLDILLSMTDDPSPEMRGSAISRLRWAGSEERDERIASVLRALLQDDDMSIRSRALDALSARYDYGEEMMDLLLEMSKDPEMRGRVRSWLMNRRNLSAKGAQRLIEMIEEDSEEHSMMHTVFIFHQARASDEAKPIMSRFCVRVLGDSLEPMARHFALESIRDMGDTSVLPELEVIARSPDAEGIEDELAQTIEHLRKRAEQAR